MHRLSFGARAGEKVHQFGDVLNRLQVCQRSQDLDPERDIEVWICCRSAEILLQPVQDQPVLNLLRLPDVGVESLVGFVGLGEQHKQLEHIAINFQLNARQIVDHMTELPRHEPWPFDRPIDRVQRYRRVQLTQALHMLSDLLMGDVLPGHSRHFRYPSCVKHCRNCVPYTVKVSHTKPL